VWDVREYEFFEVWVMRGSTVLYYFMNALKHYIHIRGILKRTILPNKLY
jgi:hypothetical protein